MAKNYSKKERLDYHIRRQGMDAASQSRNPARAIHAAMSVLDLERKAKALGVPVSRLIAQRLSEN